MSLGLAKLALGLFSFHAVMQFGLREAVHGYLVFSGYRCLDPGDFEVTVTVGGSAVWLTASALLSGSQILSSPGVGG